MAQNPNLYSAPASGFSQTISFATDTKGGLPATPGAAAVAQAQLGLRGGLGPGLQQQRGGVATGPIPSNTLAFLTKIADAAMAPRIQEQRAKAFVSGMQAAAAGEEIADIAERQPWYTKIFGDGAVVEGARIYTQQARAAELGSAIEDAMPELRSKGTAEANEYFTGLVQKSLTGDAETDSALMLGLSKVLPSAMKKHAREHYRYQQEAAVTAQSSAIQSSAALLQRGAADLATGMEPPEDYAVKQAEFVQLAIPPAGQDLGSWQKGRESDLILMAERGQFHAIAAMRKAGIMEHLRPEQQLQVERSIQANEAQWRSKAATEFVDDLTKIGLIARTAPAGSTINKLKEQITTLNKKARDAYGFDADLIGGHQQATTLEELGANIQRQLDQQAQETARRAEQARSDGNDREAGQYDTALFDSLAASGGLGSAVSVLGEKARDLQRAAVPAIMPHFGNAKPLTREGAIRVRQLGVAAAQGWVSDGLRDNLRGRAHLALQAGPDNPHMLVVYADWQKLMSDSPATAAAYFGEDLHGKLAKFDAVFNPQVPGTLALAYAAVTQPTSQPRLKDGERQDGVAAAIKHHRNVGLAWYQMARPGLEPGQDKALASVLDPLADAMPGNAQDKYKAAYGLAIGRDADIVGGFVVRRRARGDDPLLKRLKDASTVSTAGGRVLIDESRADKDFNTSIKALVKEGGWAGEELTLRDMGAGLTATWLNKNGEVGQATLPLSRIADHIAAAQVKDTPRPAPVKAEPAVPKRVPILSMKGLDPNTLLPTR